MFPKRLIKFKLDFLFHDVKLLYSQIVCFDFVPSFGRFFFFHLKIYEFANFFGVVIENSNKRFSFSLEIKEIWTSTSTRTPRTTPCSPASLLSAWRNCLLLFTISNESGRLEWLQQLKENYIKSRENRMKTPRDCYLQRNPSIPCR